MAQHSGKPFTLADDLFILKNLRKGRESPAWVANKLRRSESSVQQRKSLLKGMKDEARFSNEYKRLDENVRKMIWEYRRATFEPDAIAKLLGLDKVTVYAVMAEPIDWE